MAEVAQSKLNVFGVAFAVVVAIATVDFQAFRQRLRWSGKVPKYLCISRGRPSCSSTRVASLPKISV